MAKDKRAMRRRAQPEVAPRYTGGAILKVLHETSGDFIFRQRLIRQIEAERRRRLITYVSNVEHPGVQIDLNDAHNLETCFRSPSDLKPIDLLIHSPGGQADAAERIINLARNYSGNDFRVIVPSYAKSAATIIALGSDAVGMSDGSELGPIDPQIIIRTPQGDVRRAAASFVEHRDELLGRIKEAVPRQEPIQGFMQMLAQVDGPFVKECERAINLSKEMARKWLKTHMLKGKSDAEVQRAVDEFSDPSRTLSHGRMIDYKQARSVGIEVEYVPKESDLWEAILELLFRSTSFLNMEASRIKLYESALVSLKADAVLRAIPVRQ